MTRHAVRGDEAVTRTGARTVARVDERPGRSRAPETTSLQASTMRSTTRPAARPRASGDPGGSWRQPVPGPHLPGVVTGVTMLLGLWLLAAPALLGYGNPGGGFGPRWNDLLLGLVLVLVATTRLTRVARLGPVTAVSVAAGLWLVVAPFVLAYGFGPNSALVTFNDMAVGVTVAFLALLAHTASRLDSVGSRL